MRTLQFSPGGEAGSKVIAPQAFRWRGVDPKGKSRAGRMTLVLGELAGVIQARFEAGWRELTVCAGDGPVPPATGEERSGAIEPQLGAGERAWWAECQS